MIALAQAVDLCSLLGDPTRVRLLALLAQEELTVAELVAITELPQSRVSTHLGKLRDAGLLRDRPNGASTYYAANELGMSDDARSLWKLLDSRLADSVLEADHERCEELLRARDGAMTWPDSIAGQMERHYSPGRTWEACARGVLGFARFGDVLDIGAGDGVMATLLQPRAASVTCLDRSERVIEAARRRLRAFEGVRFAVADMHELPFDDGAFDQVLMFNVLAYSSDHGRALSEAGRVLRPRGTLGIVTLHRHDHASATRAYGHVNSGVTTDELELALGSAGLEVDACGVTSRERKAPHFEIVTAFATRKGAKR